MCTRAAVRAAVSGAVGGRDRSHVSRKNITIRGQTTHEHYTHVAIIPQYTRLAIATSAIFQPVPLQGCVLIRHRTEETSSSDHFRFQLVRSIGKDSRCAPRGPAVFVFVQPASKEKKGSGLWFRERAPSGSPKFPETEQALHFPQPAREWLRSGGNRALLTVLPVLMSALSPSSTWDRPPWLPPDVHPSSPALLDHDLRRLPAALLPDVLSPDRFSRVRPSPGSSPAPLPRQSSTMAAWAATRDRAVGSPFSSQRSPSAAELSRSFAHLGVCAAVAGLVHPAGSGNVHTAELRSSPSPRLALSPASVFASPSMPSYDVLLAAILCQAATDNTRDALDAGRGEEEDGKGSGQTAEVAASASSVEETASPAAGRSTVRSPAVGPPLPEDGRLSGGRLPPSVAAAAPKSAPKSVRGGGRVAPPPMGS